MRSWLIWRIFQSNIKGLHTFPSKLTTQDCQINKGQNIIKCKIALTCQILIWLFPVLSNFCFSTQNLWGQTKPLVAIVCFCKNWIFDLWLTVTQQPKGCQTAKGYQITLRQWLELSDSNMILCIKFFENYTSLKSAGWLGPLPWSNRVKGISSWFN